MIARCNPFRTERTDRLAYRWHGITLPQMMQRLQALNYRGAIVGPDGSGKTTLLEELETKLCRRGFPIKKYFLNRDSVYKEPPNSQSDEILLFDGADLLKGKQWRDFVKQNEGGLIITSHRKGLLPTLVECSTSLRLLEEIVEDLIGRSNDFPLANLYREHKGNLRDVLRTLYDICASYAAKEL
jgi:GTPase SAR1 family protein